MYTKIKRIAYSGAALTLLTPLMVMAQFSVPKNTKLPGEGTTVLAIITRIMTWLLIVVGIVGVIGFAIAGILYLTAAGDDDRISKAKNAMLYSIVGVVVALAGLVALTFAQNILSAQDF
jgi:uncharacterized membrane protein